MRQTFGEDNDLINKEYLEKNCDHIASILQDASDNEEFYIFYSEIAKEVFDQ